jgi:hypothetical protein
VNRVFGALLLIGLGGAASCSSTDDPSVAPQHVAKNKGDDDDSAQPVDAGTQTIKPVSTIDGGNGATATTYVGTLDTTPETQFGGSPYCFYQVALKNIDIEVTALPSGSIIGASVRLTAVEASIKPCAQEGAPPSDHVYSYTTDTELPDGRDQLAFSSAPANHPQAKLIINLKKTGNSYVAEATWHRTDEPPPLDWQITTTIALGAQ